MTTYIHPKTGRRQHLFAGSLMDTDSPIAEMVDQYDTQWRPRIVYSDPPWTAGHETMFRTSAGLPPSTSFKLFAEAFCRVVLKDSKPFAIFVEQSESPIHNEPFRDAMRAILDSAPDIKEQAIYKIAYGNPKRTNALFHYGTEPLSVDPTGMSSDKLVELCVGSVARPGCVVIDPCTGLGTTSRVAHRLGLDFIGTEIVPARMERTAAWLFKKGYVKE